ncbi:MAG: hypothetical protein U0X41_04850 [Chitinophagales bacterium]
MKRLLYKIIPVSILLFVLCNLWQGIIDKGLKRSVEYGSNYSEWDSIYKGGIDAEVLIMGSSRAKILVNPQVITDSFAKSCYNIGIDGHKFLTQYYRFLLYLQHNKPPKSILLSLDIFSLIHTKDFYAYEQFIPYMNDTMIRNIVLSSDVFSWKDIYIPMVKYTHRKDMILDGTLAYFRPTQIKNDNKRGFISIDKSWDTAFVRKALGLMYADGFTAKIDSQTNRLFLRFIDYCHANDIRLIFVYPPEFKENLGLCPNRKMVMNYYDSLSAVKKVPYFNYMAFPSIYADTSLFFDSQHMNTKGVKIFNEQLVKDMKGAGISL